MLSRPVRVGISYFGRREPQSIWANGAVQNCFFLYWLFQRYPGVGEVWMVNAGDGEAGPGGVDMAAAGVSVIGLEAAMGRLDLLIEMGAQLGPETVERARAQGARVIAYRVGNDYVMEIERVVAGKHGTGIFNGVRFDRQDPSGIGDIFVTNAIDLKRHEAFERFALGLDIVQAGRASFEARYSTPYFLARFTDVVVTHQWENGLNYLYYDAAYGRYPLVHNSDLLPGFGYQYASFDAQDGARALRETVLHHDARLEEYEQACQALLDGVSIRNAGNVAAYDALLRAICGGAGSAAALV